MVDLAIEKESLWTYCVSGYSHFPIAYVRVGNVYTPGVDYLDKVEDFISIYVYTLGGKSAPEDLKHMTLTKFRQLVATKKLRPVFVQPHYD